MKKSKLICSFVAICCVVAALCSCGSSGNFAKYVTAYNKVSAKGGMEANLTVSLKMDGQTTNCNGNFKVDTSKKKARLYYEMNIGSDKIIQFSDGDYIYTDDGTHKTKFAIDSKPEDSTEKTNGKSENNSQFKTSEFLKDFSGFLEAGKIRELGLMSPLDSSVVSSTKVNGNDYTLTVSKSLVKKLLNVMVTNETGKTNKDTVQIDELKDFSYTATIEKDIVEKVNYKGTVVVNVPAALMTDGKDKTYELEFDITVDFINPGKAVTVSLPSTADFEEPNQKEDKDKKK